MKQILFLFFLLHAGAMFAQVSATEVISSESSYLPFQDSLLVLRTVTVSTTELEGVNDTTISYSAPIDSAGLAQQVINAYLNEANTKAARLRNAIPMRFFLQDYNNAKANAALLGENLDSTLVAQYKRFYLGAWRVWLADGTTYVADVVENPANAGLLRITGRNGEGNINMTLYGRYHLRISSPTVGAVFLNWDGVSRDNPIFRVMTYGLPPTVAASSNIRLLKIR